jgi:hypothetical protein
MPVTLRLTVPAGATLYVPDLRARLEAQLLGLTLRRAQEARLAFERAFGWYGLCAPVVADDLTWTHDA